MLKTLVRRIEVAERAAVGRLKFSEDCICFPAKEPAVFLSDEEQETAYTATHFTLEAHYQVSSPSVSQGVEFSSNKHIDTKWYKFSVQCSYYKGVFSVWDTAGSKWSATNIPCKRPARNTWEHLKIQTEISNGKAVFKSLTHNGVTYAINKSFYPRKSSSAYSFGVHFQMNGNRGGDSYYVWVDNLKFTLW